MTPIPNIESFISFSELDTPNYTCIYYLPHLDNGRRCKNSITSQDLVLARTLRERIIRYVDQIVPLEMLQQCALVNCCRRARHQAFMSNYLLHQRLALRWQAELASKCASTNLVSMLSQIDLTSDDEYDEFAPYEEYPPQTVFDVLYRVFDDFDGLTGSIYILTRTSSPGFVKIGYTTRAVEERVAEWENDCGHALQIVASFTEIPYVKRVETLIHFELHKEWRCEVRCNRCEKQHIEWFEILSERAIEVASKWTEWMKTAMPYNRRFKLSYAWDAVIKKLYRTNLQITAQQLLDLHETNSYITLENAKAIERTTFTEIVVPLTLQQQTADYAKLVPKVDIATLKIEKAQPPMVMANNTSSDILSITDGFAKLSPSDRGYSGPTTFVSRDQWKVCSKEHLKASSADELGFSSGRLRGSEESSAFPALERIFKAGDIDSRGQLQVALLDSSRLGTYEGGPPSRVKSRGDLDETTKLAQRVQNLHTKDTIPQERDACNKESESKSGRVLRYGEECDEMIKRILEESRETTKDLLQLINTLDLSTKGPEAFIELLEALVRSRVAYCMLLRSKLSQCSDHNTHIGNLVGT